MERSTTNLGDEWSELARQDERARERAMLQRYRELAALPEQERFDELETLAKSEYTLSNDLLVPFTKSRLRCFLTLEEDAAKKVAASYDKVMQKMSADAAMRRVTIVQSLAIEFTPAEEERLVDLIPNVFAGGLGHRGASHSMAELMSRPSDAGTRRKPLWAFWRK